MKNFFKSLFRKIFRQAKNEQYKDNDIVVQLVIGRRVLTEIHFDSSEMKKLLVNPHI